MMSLLLDIASFWPARVAVAGGIVLLAGRLLFLLSRQPVRRAVVGTAAVVAALMVIPLSLLPGWLPVPVTPTLPELTVASNGDPVPALPESPNDTPYLAHSVLVFELPDAAPAVNPPFAPSVGSKEAVSPPSLQETVPQSASTSRSAIEMTSVALGAYILITAAFFLRLLIAQLGLIRLWRKAHAAPTWAEQIFRQLAKDECPSAQLRVIHRAVGPVCFGVLYPRVLIPVSLLMAGDGGALRTVFAHELGHLRRRDPLSGWLLGLARAIYFLWPWVAGLRREVRIAQEHLADADAARIAGSAEYAELLIRLTRARPAPLGAAGVRGPSSELYRRITMLLKSNGKVESHCPRRWAIAIGGGLTAVAIALAGLYLPVRSADAAEPQRKEAEDKPVPKPAPRPDTLKDTIDKLLKDAGDDPEVRKQIEELLKSIGQRKPGDAPVPVPAVPPAVRVPPVPLQPGVIGRPDINVEMDQAQEMIRRYMEAMQEQMKALQGRRGVVIGANGPIGGRFGNPFGAGASSGRLGIRVERPSDVLASQLDLPNGQGLVCTDVPADSPAGKAGIKPNDILLEVAGKPVSNNQDEFVKALKDVKPDTAVDIVVLRKGKKETVKGAKLPEAKEPVIQDPFNNFPGVRLVPAPPIVLPRVGATPAIDGDILPRGRGIGVVAGPGETVRVEKVNDAFTVFYSKNGIKVTVTGSKEGDGDAKAESIEIEDDGKTIKAESVDKLPKEYQELAKSALKAIK